MKIEQPAVSRRFCGLRRRQRIRGCLRQAGGLDADAQPHPVVTMIFQQREDWLRFAVRILENLSIVFELKRRGNICAESIIAVLLRRVILTCRCIFDHARHGRGNSPPAARVAGWVPKGAGNVCATASAPAIKKIASAKENRRFNALRKYTNVPKFKTSLIIEAHNA